ncbi:MAG: HAD family hydrolase [Polyangiaceae bacterium]
MGPSRHFDRRVASGERSGLLRRLVASARRGSIVFDLDGTLLDNRPRVVRIFHELADAWATKHPAAADLCRAAVTERIVYGLADNMRRLGVTDEALIAEAFTFWRERFFYDAYMKYDTATPGAVSFVRACYDAGALIVYLTGRDLPNMALGTFASLRDLGFPIGVANTSLITKPTFEMPDTDFKLGVAPQLSLHTPVLASIDNEPANVNLFLELHPESLGILIDTQHAPDPPELDPRAHVIDSFEVDA